MTEQPKKLDLSSHDIAADKLAALRMAFPEVFTEGGKVDFDKLKMTLGESVDVGKERYGMNWPGKAECFKTIQRPSMATLVPARNESVNFDTTQNLIIEGDNLEVLKLLQKSYLGKVKMIYIDPPYNTGNDFIYPDNYSESLDTYLRYTGQVDNEGRKYSTNTEADGRFHSKWMNMMYPRLFLARNLLREDGVIFISIDDNEVENLKKLCNEIFGEEGFVGVFPWRKRTAKSDVPFGVSQDFEWIMAFAKRDFLAGQKTEREYYETPDQKYRWRMSDLTKQCSKDERPNSFFDLVNPRDGKSYPANPNRVWAITNDTAPTYISAGKIVFPGDYDFLRIAKPAMRVFENEDKAKSLEKYGSEQAKHAASTLLPPEVGRSEDGNAEILELFGEKIFNYAKPSGLISHFIRIATNSDDIILDFFAGSGATAQAVLELNKSDGQNRRYILVQLPEPTDRQDFPVITDITKERVRRIIKKLNEADDKSEERGFKVFKLQSSNFKAWNTEQPKDDVELAKQLTLHVEHLVVGRTQDDVLYELLLKSGFPLNTPIEKVTLANKTVFSIADGMMMVCLENELTLEVLKEIADKKPERVVCLDAGFANNDQLKTNAVQTMKAKGVTKFQTV